MSSEPSPSDLGSRDGHEANLKASLPSRIPLPERLSEQDHRPRPRCIGPHDSVLDGERIAVTGVVLLLLPPTPYLALSSLEPPSWLGRRSKVKKIFRGDSLGKRLFEVCTAGMCVRPARTATVDRFHGDHHEIVQSSKGAEVDRRKSRCVPYPPMARA
ncbi:hypothetical protein IE53DRAFT_389346 [Violaceomyces palustris]|uniref:Uncharacterized protein n=1 Tax=Violaceomyces palustris TaxID=1673888 RepID=A0ACD0NRM9_9BASI|nr:hypothetical protein IE53DRAFT_389346 [Violaceomyces palustris]